MMDSEWHTFETLQHNGYTIEHQYKYWAGRYEYRYCALGRCGFRSIGEAEMAIDDYIKKQSEDTAKEGPDTEKPEPPDEGKGGGEGAGGSGGGEWSGGRQGGYPGWPGESPGSGWNAPYSPSQPTLSAKATVPDWMQERFNYWDEKQKQLLEAARAAYQYSGQKYEESWKQVGEQGKAAAQALQHGYGQALGMLAQDESQQQSALARYAATGRMSSGSAEQLMTESAREIAKGAMGAYGQYAAARGSLGESMMKTYAALGAEASKYTQMVVDAMKAIPNPYEDWGYFMTGLTAYSGVAVS